MGSVLVVDDKAFPILHTVPNAEGTLKERLLAKMQSFQGQKFDARTQDIMTATIMGELAHARDSGELEFDDLSKVEVSFEQSLDFYGTRVSIHEKQPKPPPAPKVKKPRGPSTPPDHDWEKRMSIEEADWCHGRISEHSRGLFYVDTRRAAKIWKSSQVRRFRRIESYFGCCGSTNFTAKKWNPETKREDIYLLGYNHGH